VPGALSFERGRCSALSDRKYQCMKLRGTVDRRIQRRIFMRVEIILKSNRSQIFISNVTSEFRVLLPEEIYFPQ